MYTLTEKDREILEEVKRVIAASSTSSCIYVGCDSKRVRKSTQVKYATVIILHHDGKHGGRMWSFMDTEQAYGPASNPRMRLVNEAFRAVMLAQEVMDEIGDRHFELHLDLNPNPMHKSNAAVKESLGFVLGTLGIEAKLKPEAWASSTAADKLTQ
jgi:predicted RNase H-related nuclease YkuK (DUF458 family)